MKKKGKLSKKPTAKTDFNLEEMGGYPFLFPSPNISLHSSEVNSQMIQIFNYYINDQGKLLNSQTNEAYQFGIDYEALSTYVAVYIQAKLREDYGLVETWIPANTLKACNIFMSQDFFENTQKLLVIIPGRGKVRPGQ